MRSACVLTCRRRRRDSGAESRAVMPGLPVLILRLLLLLQELRLIVLTDLHLFVAPCLVGRSAGRE